MHMGDGLLYFVVASDKFVAYDKFLCDDKVGRTIYSCIFSHEEMAAAASSADRSRWCVRYVCRV